MSPSRDGERLGLGKEKMTPLLGPPFLLCPSRDIQAPSEMCSHPGKTLGCSHIAQRFLMAVERCCQSVACSVGKDYRRNLLKVVICLVENLNVVCSTDFLGRKSDRR